MPGFIGARHFLACSKKTVIIPAAEYAQLAPRFNPVKFDADAWAQMAADAGMK